MALTLAQGNEYSTTEMQRAVIDRLVKDSEILQRLPFVAILGNSLTYDTITTDAGADFYSVGDTWTESTPDVTQATAALKILGGDADVDNFLLKTRSNKIDLQGTVLGNKVKAVQYKFLDTLYYGNATTNTKEFNGLQLLLASTTYNTVQSATANGDGAAATIAKMRQTKDLITGWKPDVMAMSKTMRRLLSTYLDSVGSAFPRGVDRFGNQVEMFDNTPIIVDDHILNTESTTDLGVYESSTTDDQTTIYFLTFDEMACCGIHSGDGVQVEEIGNLETKDAKRWRVKWYPSMMFQDLRSCSKYIGILSGSAVTA